MEAQELKDLLEKLLDGRLGGREFKTLFLYLRNLISSVGNHVSEELRKKKGLDEIPVNILERIASFRGYEEDPLEDLTRDFICHLLSKKVYFKGVLEIEANVRPYLWATVRNFLIDSYRACMKSITIVVREDAVNAKERSAKELRRIRELELIEIENLVKRTISGEEVKYLCYMLDSKRYSCLWGDRSKDAVYKDVSRKRKEIFRKIGEALVSEQVDEDLFSEFLRVKLSGWCEDLRSKFCKEEEA